MTRTSKDIGDTRTLPFLKDLINIGIKRFSPDIIFFSNADTCFCNNVIERVSESLGQKDCCYAKRRNFPKLEQEIGPDKIGEGILEPYGVDLLVFTRKWWDEYESYIPDLLIGVFRWDIIFSDIMAITTPFCEIKDVIYHKIHDYFWSSPQNAQNPGQKHNDLVSKECYSKYRILRHVVGLVRGEYSNTGVGTGSIEYELKSIYMKESNLLKFFCQ